MTRRLHIRVAALAAVATLGLAACADSGTGDKTEDDELQVGMAVANISLNFAASMVDGAEQAADHNENINLKVVGPPNTDGPAEEQLFTALTKTATDGVVLENLDPPIFTRPSATAVDAGVPIIALDTSPMEGSKVTTYVGNDNYELGATLAEETLKRMDEDPQGTIVIGVPNPGTPVLDSRAQGIIDTFKEQAPGVKALGPYQTYSDPAQNFGAWQALVNANPDALAFLGVGDADSYDLAKIKKDQDGDYLVAAFDVDAKTLEYVKEGVLFCTIDPEHFLKGYIAMQLLIDNARGEDMPEGWFKTTGLVVDETNIDDIIARQESPEAAYDFYEDTFAEMLGDVDANMHPLEDAPLSQAAIQQHERAVLTARDVLKTYGGVTALAGVDIALRAGEIHAVVGENGAGKSTLVKVLCGVTRPDRGEVSLDGKPVRFGSSRDAAAEGIAFVAQELSLFPDLSVRENLFPLDPDRRLGVVRNRALDERSLPVLVRLGLSVDQNARVGDLSLADQQLLEIGRALLQEPRVLVLDEPTSAQSRAAVDRLDGVLRALAGEGLAILYISHFLEEVMRIADRVTVLRDSSVALADAPAGEVDLARLVEAMIGGELPVVEDRQAADRDAADARASRRLRLEDVHVPGQLDGLTMHVAAGEIVGVAGLQGAGHEAVLELVCGRRRPASGTVRLPGDVQPRSLRHAYRHGVGFVPRDRKARGVTLDQTVRENIASVTWLGLARGGVWQRTRRQRQRAEELVERLRIRGDADTRVGDLSGGNQQKVVFAKWMDAAPSVVVLDDPTRGVDVGVRAEMHGLIREFASQGRVVLIASSDLAELAELCDRVLVLQRGRVVDTLSGERLDQRSLSTAMNAGFATTGEVERIETVVRRRRARSRRGK